MHHSARTASLDGPQLIWLAAGMLACAVAARTGQRRWWLVVAVCAGLAGASKLQARGDRRCSSGRSSPWC